MKGQIAESKSGPWLDHGQSPGFVAPLVMKLLPLVVTRGGYSLLSTVFAISSKSNHFKTGKTIFFEVGR